MFATIYMGLNYQLVVWRLLLEFWNHFVRKRMKILLTCNAISPVIKYFCNVTALDYTKLLSEDLSYFIWGGLKLW